MNQEEKIALRVIRRADDPATMLEDHRLSWAAKGILAYMYLAGGEGVTKKDLVEMGVCGETRVKTAMQCAFACGYVEPVLLRGEGGKLGGWRWRLTSGPNSDPSRGRRPAVRPVQRRRIFHRDRSTCRYCGARLAAGERTVDHVDPQGDTEDENLVTACTGCNAAKGPRTPEEAGMELIHAG